jgi:hypothetical protein
MPAWAAVLGTLALTASAGTSWAAVTTTRVSVSTAGDEITTDGGFHPSISGDDRFVVFGSRAPDLIPGDTNRRMDVFLRDLTRHTTRRVSLTDGDGQAAGGASNGQISADGRLVAFQSASKDLLPRGRRDTNGSASDVFVRNLKQGTTRLVSRNTRGEQGRHDTRLWDISGTGRYVLFSTRSRNFPPLGRANAAQALFVRDRHTKRTMWVPGSVTDIGSFNIQQAQVSDNGRFVAFAVLGRPRRRVLADLATGRKTHLECAAVACTTLMVDDLSPAGRFVSLTTFSNAGPRNIVLYDARAKTESLVSVDSNGVPGNNLSMASALARGARFVVYASRATNLVPGDTNDAWDVFRLNRVTGGVDRVDLTAGGGQIPTGIGPLLDPTALPCLRAGLSDERRGVLAVSRDGSVVVFATDDGSVVAADTNNLCDIFARGDGL